MRSAGRTRELSFFELLQLSHHERRTCALHVTDGAFLEGVLRLSQGEPIYARFGELSGDEAVQAMVGQPSLVCRELPIGEPVERNVESSLPLLVRQAAAAIQRQTLPDALHGVAVSMERPLELVAPAPPARETVRRGRVAGLAALGLVLLVGVLWLALRSVREGPDVVLHAAQSEVATAAAAATTRPASASEVAALPTAAPSARPTRHLVVKGSDTIGAALGPALARVLESREPGLRVHVEALGSSTGFAALLDGSAQVAASSRRARDDEHATARKLGITLHEVTVARDAIAVIVHPKSALTTLDVGRLARIFRGDLTSYVQLGGPKLAIRALGRPSYSGTHQFFRERVLGVLGPGVPFAASVASIEASDEVVAEVASDEGAIAYVSLGHANERVRSLPIAAEPGGPAVAPTVTSVRDGSYPLGRALYLYVRSDAGAEARALVAVALSDVGQKLVADHGFVPLAPGEARALPDPAPARASEHAVVRIYFEPGSHTLGQGVAHTLTTTARQIIRGRRAVIIGNADSEGAPDEQARIARLRAEAVLAQLRSLGVASERMTIERADAEHPLASNETPEGRRENCRADVLIVPDR